jgi:GntR family transcriptional regulator/MocR family aminotransferase
LPTVEAGLHLCLRLDSLAREQALVSAARNAGVEMNGLSGYWLPDSPAPEDARAGLVLGFAAVPEAQIVDAVQRLRQAWKL